MRSFDLFDTWLALLQVSLLSIIVYGKIEQHPQGKQFCVVTKNSDQLLDATPFSNFCSHYVLSDSVIVINDAKFHLDEKLLKKTEEFVSLSRAGKNNDGVKILIELALVEPFLSFNPYPQTYEALCSAYTDWKTQYGLGGLVVNNLIDTREEAVKVLRTLRSCMDRDGHEFYLTGPLKDTGYYTEDSLNTLFDGLLVSFTQKLRGEVLGPLPKKNKSKIPSMENITDEWFRAGFPKSKQYGEIRLTNILFTGRFNPYKDERFQKYESYYHISLKSACELTSTLPLSLYHEKGYSVGRNKTHILLLETPHNIYDKAFFMKAMGLVGIFIRYLNQDATEVLSCTGSNLPLTRAATLGFSNASLNKIPVFSMKTVK